MIAFCRRPAFGAGFWCACVFSVAFVFAQPAGAEDLKAGAQGPLEPSPKFQNLRQQEHRVPFKADGTGPLLQATLTLPDGAGPWPGIVINHGAPRKAEDRVKRSPYTNTTVWFAHKGFVVLNLTRRGYGKSQGGYNESFGKCEFPYYKESGDASADDVAAALRYLRAMPMVDKNRIVVAGTSAGGFATLATIARNPEGVVLGLNFAGGRGSQREGMVCGGGNHLVDAVAAWGKTARVPSLWLYAENDRFWGTELPKNMVAAWRAGGAPTDFWAAPEFPHHRDGHVMFGHRNGRDFWGPTVEAALKKAGFAK